MSSTSRIDVESLVSRVAQQTKEIVDAEAVLLAAGIVKDGDEDLSSRVDKLVKKAEQDVANAKKA